MAGLGYDLRQHGSRAHVHKCSVSHLWVPQVPEGLGASLTSALMKTLQATSWKNVHGQIFISQVWETFYTISSFCRFVLHICFLQAEKPTVQKPLCPQMHWNSETFILIATNKITQNKGCREHTLEKASLGHPCLSAHEVGHVASIKPSLLVELPVKVLSEPGQPPKLLSGGMGVRQWPEWVQHELCWFLVPLGHRTLGWEASKEQVGSLCFFFLFPKGQGLSSPRDGLLRRKRKCPRVEQRNRGGNFENCG